MPLPKKGASQKQISKYISHEMKKFKRTGKFGSSKPKSKEAARKQIVAAALTSAGKSKKMNEGTKPNFEQTVNKFLAEFNNLG